MTLYAEGLTVDHLKYNGANLDFYKEAILAEPVIKVFIDSAGINSTYGRGASQARSADADPMSDFRVQKIRDVFLRLDAALSIDFAYVGSREDSNIAIMQYSEQVTGVNPHGGVALAYLRPLNYDRSTGSWRYKYENDIGLISKNDSFISKGSNHWEHVIIHEIAHSLLLEHPFESSDGDVFGDESYPTVEHSVMSYGDPSTWGKYSSWYQPIDMQALTSLWGQEPGYQMPAEMPQLTGGIGSNNLLGTTGADRFEFTTFDTAPDVITGFNGAQGDKIVLHGDVFGGWIAENKDLYLGIAYTAKKERKLQTSKWADIIYNASNGNLFYNMNEGGYGFGSGGGIFAVLQGAPTLTRDSFEVI